ncbi:MAG TPA: hypothetical protein VKS99_14620 [Blastocatellia bacterium]|nr:hypothetical protein [Blastocatellia bacterium]
MKRNGLSNEAARARLRRHGPGALREFLRTTEECDSPIFEQADLNAGNVTGDRSHTAALRA